MRWHLLLKECKIEWQHIKGEHNIVADALSQLPIDDLMDDMEMKETNSPTDIAYAVMRKRKSRKPVSQWTRHKLKSISKKMLNCKNK
jgi:hypothetical protein